MYTKTEAVILKKTNYTNKDVLVTAYTEKWGKRTFLARGLRKKQAKLKSALHPLRVSLLIVVAGRNFPIITGAELEKEFGGLEANFFYHGLALFMTEIVDHLHPEPRPQSRVFATLSYTLGQLDKFASGKRGSKKRAYMLLFWFILFLLKQAGFTPRTDYCARCGNKLSSGEEKFFSPSEGGVCCQQCSQKLKDVFPANPKTVSVLKSLLALKNFREKNFSTPAKKEHLENLKKTITTFCYHIIEAEPATKNLVNL